MNTLLFCYANDRNRPLPSLGEEDALIDRLLDPRSSRNHFQKIRDSFATAESVTNKILTYQDSLCLFHFSGHAGNTILQFEDTTARGMGMAQLLARCPNLRLVFLNGCSTLHHIQLLRALNVNAAVIATATPIEDQTATRFALGVYRALNNQHTLVQAVEMARLEIQVTASTSIQQVERAMLVDSMEEVSRNQWYFFCPDSELARWELPTGEATGAAEYKPNTGLRTTLFQSLRAFDPTLTESFKSKQQLPPEALKSWLNEELLRRLPYPIAEPLRRLLCPPLSPAGKLLPVTPDRDRLINYVSLFDGSVSLLVGTLLSQIREYLQQAEEAGKSVELGPELEAHLGQLLTDGWAGLEPQPLLTMLRAMGQFLVSRQIDLFINEMHDLARLFSEQPVFFESLAFFHDLRQRLSSPAHTINIDSLCQIGEDHLVDLLKNMGFWAHYRLESVRNIRTLHFFNRKPEYAHEKAVLRTSQSYRLEDLCFQEVKMANIWDSQSVVLVRTSRQPGANGQMEDAVAVDYLSLSPFFIDRNVFLRSDNAVFDLYSFYSITEGQLRFSHIARPEDLLLKISLSDSDTTHQQDYSMLREQFRIVQSLFSLVPATEVAQQAQEDDIDLSLLA
ncbi:hypothetical protein GCM10023189_60830 [Nibrella saemangeumensis]|uniref:CHAT domain-containing protein n=1 Tax=Nibrella saemangeumensis TaxID=1084526 RepID=A0ABP8NQ85_9BACT